jgi:poly(A) polymerase/tRNA nucleotidyltransferase (CCA-adding enzyme)
MDHWLPELATVAREDPRWQSTLAAIDAIPRSRAFLRLVRLLLALPREDAGEPGTRSDEVDRPAAGATSVSAIMDRLKFSRSESRRAEMLWSRYLPLVSPVDSAAAVREWLSEAGRDQARDLFRLHFALARASGARESERVLIHVWGRVHDELVGGAPLELSDLAVDGNDMIGLGLPRGPLVGLMLEELHAQVIEDPSRNQRETLLAEARELIELGALDGLDGDL